ncbi:MAG: ABC transporter ATP-binding protein [Lachnospiraceae bacterium]|nr:ABC transporter ATP-binding protein [Lachnospiraceae bacterium]
MCILKVTNLCKSYKKKQIVNNISFEVVRGEMCALLGANGSGKTTITHMITDLTHKNSGKVEIAGYDLDNEYKKAISRVGMCFDKFMLFEDMSGYENLKLCSSLCAGEHSSIEDMLDCFGLTDAAGEKVKNYSSGMKQKLAIARAVIKKPDLLIMDEPVNMLDHKSAKELYHTLYLLKEQGMSVLIITHLIKDIEPYADSVVFIKNGVIQLKGKVKDIIKEKNKDMEEIYDELC